MLMSRVVHDNLKVADIEERSLARGPRVYLPSPSTHVKGRVWVCWSLWKSKI